MLPESLTRLLAVQDPLGARRQGGRFSGAALGRARTGEPGSGRLLWPPAREIELSALLGQPAVYYDGSHERLPLFLAGILSEVAFFSTKRRANNERTFPLFCD